MEQQTGNENSRKNVKIPAVEWNLLSDAILPLSITCLFSLNSLQKLKFLQQSVPRTWTRKKRKTISRCGLLIQKPIVPVYCLTLIEFWEWPRKLLIWRRAKSKPARQFTWPVSSHLRRFHHFPNTCFLLLVAVLEYLASELVELSDDAAKNLNKKTIKPRHVMLAIRSDEELEQLAQGCIIPQGGVIPNINAVLLPKKTTRRRSKSKTSQNTAESEAY